MPSLKSLIHTYLKPPLLSSNPSSISSYPGSGQAASNSTCLWQNWEAPLPASPPTSGCRATPGPVCLTTNMEVDRHQEPLALEEFPSFIQSSPSPCDVLAEAFIIPPVHRSSYWLFSCSAHPLCHHFSLQKVKILTPQVNYWCPYVQPHCLLRVDQRGPGDILRTSPALHTYRISHIFVTQPQPLGC